MCIEQVQTTPSYNKYFYRNEINKISQIIPHDCKTFYYIPLYKNPNLSFDNNQIDAMWAQIIVNIPTINGYGGWHPNNWLPIFNYKLTSKSDSPIVKARILRWLHINGVKKSNIIQVETDECIIFGLSKAN